MLQPYEGRVYDPCCGSSGMFVQSIRFIQAHATGNGNARPGPRSSGAQTAAAVSIYGQESNYTTWRMARMNLAIRGIEGQIAHGDSFHNDRHPDLRADYILANPPFNVSDWGGERLQGDQRWRYGDPPRGNANFAWVQHFLHHLAPRGRAGFVLANGSMSSNQSGEGQIRKNIVEAGLVDCIVALPGQLFRSTQIPACLWFLSTGSKRPCAAQNARRNPLHRRPQPRPHDRPHPPEPLRRRHRPHRNHLPRLAQRQRYASFSPPSLRRERVLGVRVGENAAPASSPGDSPAADDVYADIPGFCKSATLEEIRKHAHVLTPGRYVGAAPQEDDGEPFEQKMARLTTQWRQQQAEARRLDAAIEENLDRLGFGTGQGSRAEG